LPVCSSAKGGEVQESIQRKDEIVEAGKRKAEAGRRIWSSDFGLFQLFIYLFIA
jgi:hypothetical protein